MIKRGHSFFGNILSIKVSVALCFSFLLVVDGFTAAPPMVSQVVSVNGSLKDEFGGTLKGTDPSASYFGITPIEGDLVHIYTANDGVYAPNTNGLANPLNVLVKETKIGLGVLPTNPNPGNFSCIISPRPSGGVQIFVRVFNAPTLEEASFYMDSQVFTVSSMENENFIADFEEGMVALDENDNDDDGLNNAWEKSYGSDPFSGDSDGDGSGDQDEITAGTDLNDNDSTFSIFDMEPFNDNEFQLTWQSEVGRLYTIEYKENIGDESPFIAIDVITGNGTEIERSVPASTGSAGMYRIKVEQAPDPE